jgi:sugar lactone lactonase YvrE
MSTETRLREALREIALDGTPSPDQWQRLVARRRARRPWPVVAAAAATVAVAVLAAVVVHQETPRPPTAPPTSSATPPPDPVLATVAVRNAYPLALDGDALWAADPGAGDLVRVDVATHTVRRIHLASGGGAPLGAVVAGRAVWTAVGDQVVRVDPTTGAVLSRTAGGPGDNAHGSAVDGDHVWTMDGYGRAVRELDARGAVIRTVQLPKQLPYAGIAVGHGAVWINGAGGLRDAARVDLVTGQVTTLRIPYLDGNGQGNVAVTDDSVWMESGDLLVRLDPVSGTVTATIPLPEVATVFAMTAVGPTLWVVGNQANALYRVDSPTATVAGSVGIAAPIAVAADRTRVWVSGENGVEQIDPARVVGDHT